MEFKNKNIILKIEKNSIAEECGIEEGDILHSINGKIIKDILDYRYMIVDEHIVIEIEKLNGEVWEIEIEDHDGSDLGIEFYSQIIDDAKSCTNKCIFCFIDQLPKGMRDTLYFKDDDSRLSFLQGNFVTLTNMNDDDIDRIIEYKISPINVSVHTTNSDLRKFMLKNKFSGNVLGLLKKLCDGGISINAQIVSCPGVNNKEELIRTIEDLEKLYPELMNIAVVPVGITKYRDDLPMLKTYTKEESKKEIFNISKLQEKFLKRYGEVFVRLSDEFYVNAQMEIPKNDFYGEYNQLEDGVGMIRYFQESIKNTIDNIKMNVEGNFKIVTGVLAYKFIEESCMNIEKVNPKINIDVICVENEFFGETISVAGLLTAQDIIKKIKMKPEVRPKEVLIISDNMLRTGEDVFLDNLSLDEFKEKLSCKVAVAKYTGEDLIEIINNNTYIDDEEMN